MVIYEKLDKISGSSQCDTVTNNTAQFIDRFVEWDEVKGTLPLDWIVFIFMLAKGETVFCAVRRET